jgi:hypothetical protein
MFAEEKDRQTDRKTDRQTDRQTDGLAEVKDVLAGKNGWIKNEESK